MINNKDKEFPILQTERLILRELTEEDASTAKGIFLWGPIQKLRQWGDVNM
ncbi:hypothetical protein [Natronincola ferrireducens]|uniref:Uncharacterized protein n=1 Tax=Natronincola ferrireducens TaxID=393762 RepID=A0A1G8Z8Z2_9FIRM|nr:hypothetical protein [Natronincola ferrireducens]SDK11566.1 hypothetical protein SAMN05660472_00776 [Natronincola ferrireducens]